MFLVVALGVMGCSGSGDNGGGAMVPVAVSVTPIERGPIALQRTFSGTLVSQGQLTVAAPINGRLTAVLVDLADPVERGQIVARLDDRAQLADVAQAEAALAVSRAAVAQADAALTIATQEAERAARLAAQSATSAVEVERAEATRLAQSAALAAAKADALRTSAALQSARIALQQTRIQATWSDDDPTRFVSARLKMEGENVNANEPVLTVVALDPLDVVFSVTERDYGQLVVDQTAQLYVDGFPEHVFEGRIARISPAFDQDTRQARVEVELPNPEQQLKPGMFGQVQITLDRQEDATIVPVEAIVSREEARGVFLLSANQRQVSWHVVTEGIRQGDRVQVFGESLTGSVVVLGQQLLREGSPVILPETPGDEATP